MCIITNGTVLHLPEDLYLMNHPDGSATIIGAKIDNANTNRLDITDRVVVVPNWLRVRQRIDDSHEIYW